MKTADLYIRVSTDEQADKGYSQRSQEELLRRYCDINKTNIRKVIFEDHSAKTFNRPEWQKYLQDLRKHKSQTDLVLFLKWDRFSRNAGDAYQMINILRKLGVEPQAIEQPLDLSIPENKMMLAFYLAAPEVENDRRALNVIHGMRRARKEGRYMGLAPIGYINKTDEGGKKLIAPKYPDADIIRWSFEKIAEGIYNTEQVYKKVKEKGFKGTKSLFWFVIRNPVYCGKIFIPKYKDEESRFVKGQHEPIIAEALYYQVQDVLDGRKRGQYRLKVASNATMPLRGFLICPHCGKLLTGSASKGRYKYYSYYHCFDGCTCRFKADHVNNLFEHELKKYIPRPEMAEVYKIALAEAWTDQTNHLQNDRKQVLAQIKELEEKLSYIRHLLSSRQLDPEDFREMKSEYSSKLEKLEVKLSVCDDGHVGIDQLLNRGLDNLLRLDYIYETGDIEKKREVIGSMYPEKLTFDGFVLRTTRVNEAVRFIYMMNSELEANKNRTNGKNSNLSCQVEFGGLPWMQAVFYGVGAAVIGIIAVSSYRLSKKSLGRDVLLWILFSVLAVTTFVFEEEIIWLILLSGIVVGGFKSPPSWLRKSSLVVTLPVVGMQVASLQEEGKLTDIAWFFIKAGAFVFGSGLAIVPFLYGGVVNEYGWLNEQQFVDGVAVAMITPGPVVITVGFIGYLVGGVWGAVVAAAATFLPCYLFTVLPAPYFRKYGKHPGIKAFVDGVTAAAIGAIAGAVGVLATRTINDIPTVCVALVTIIILLKFKNLQEPYVIVAAALIGIAYVTYVATIIEVLFSESIEGEVIKGFVSHKINQFIFFGDNLFKRWTSFFSSSQ